MTRYRPLLICLTVALAIVAACDPDAPTTNSCAGTVSIAGPWMGNEAEYFQQVLQDFKKRTQCNISYEPLPRQTVEGLLGTPPTIAILPQPGLLRDLIYRADIQETKVIYPLDQVTSAEIRAYQDRDPWTNAASVDGKLYGVFFKTDHKSIVWYRKDEFEQAGIAEPPRTWTDFVAASQRLVAAGFPAIALAAGDQDGWPLTDWFENVYIGQSGIQKYDELAQHQIPWTDPSVERALSTIRSLWSLPGVIQGGVKAATSTSFAKSAADFLNPQGKKAAMLYEGDFLVTAAESEGAALTLDPKLYGWFSFPTDAGTHAVIVGGDMAVMMQQPTPAAERLMRYLASPEAAKPWVTASKGADFISPNQLAAELQYPAGSLEPYIITDLRAAPVVRFDMSDLAPTAFGILTEWPDFQDFLKNLDQSDDVQVTLGHLERDASNSYVGTSMLAPPATPPR